MFSIRDEVIDMRHHPQPSGHTMPCIGVRFQHMPSGWVSDRSDEGVPWDLVRLVVVVVAGLLLLSLL